MSKYISYFQSVTSIGIMTHAKNIREAEQKAKLKLKNKDGVNYCVFDQSDFEFSNTEIYDPEIDSQEIDGGVNLKFKPDRKTKNIIATRLQKSPKELTSNDIEGFVKECVEVGLKA